MISISFQQILKKHSEIFNSLDTHEIENLVSELLSYRETGRVIGLGAGRMGYSLRSFIMRLSHIGFKSYMIGDTNLPRINHNDIILVNSSSGNTPSILLYTKQAKQAGANVILLCASHDSEISKLADKTIFYRVEDDFQLMKTTYEQFSFLFWDFVAQKLIVAGNFNVSEIEYNHSILE